jgi:hypothetical protein
VLSACEIDAVVHAQFFKVTGLVDPPARLFHPAFIYRVATANLRRTTGLRSADPIGDASAAIETARSAAYETAQSAREPV